MAGISEMKGGSCMHWMMWVFWGFFAAIFIVAYLVDVLTRRKYSLNTQEKTLNQNIAEANARRDIGQNNNHGGMF